MTEDIWNELNEGEIHARDSLQFELKSEFFIHPHLKHNTYKQEFYLFIPNSLQVNSENYSRNQFYLDQTNLIRYKTPFMSFSDLINGDNPLSPLTRLYDILRQSNFHLFLTTASDELKLFAAIFRGTIRDTIYEMVKNPIEFQNVEKTFQMIVHLCVEISEVSHKFRQLQELSQSRDDAQLIRHFKYVDEFNSIVIEEFLTLLLKQYRSLERRDLRADKRLVELIIQEKLYREKKHLGPKTLRKRSFPNELILYRQGLLHHFVLECLMLRNFRFSAEEKYHNLLGAIAAGVAMAIYMTLLVWHASTIVINSFPFVALAVALYILKDRVKEGFKTFYSKQAHRWFPDYSTEIKNFKGFKIGRLTESFAFIDKKQLPHRFLKMRNRYFHEELQALHRHETIMQYKREMILNPPPQTEERRHEVTTIFRLNIHRFLQKASNAFQTNLSLDPYTQEISEKLLPKVYHLNLIICNSFHQENLVLHEEMKMYRVVIDKNGIKRVEHIHPPQPCKLNP